MWGGFAIFWEYSAFHSNAPVFMKIWGVPFVLVGLYLMAGRFLVDAWVRRRITYGVTNHRVIVVAGSRRSRVVSHAISQLDRIDLAEHRDGTGTIFLDGRRIGLHSKDWHRDNV
jgi:hypothetical protein